VRAAGAGGQAAAVLGLAAGWAPGAGAPGAADRSRTEALGQVRCAVTRVALLGGSFNPPHVGHLLAAHYVRATQGVDEVWLMPSHNHPFGKALTPFVHRLGMCEVLCKDTSGWMRTTSVESEPGLTGRTVD